MIVLLSGDEVMDREELLDECRQEKWIPVVAYLDHRDDRWLPVFPTELDAWKWAQRNLDKQAGRASVGIAVWYVQPEFQPLLHQHFKTKPYPPSKPSGVEVVPIEWGV